MILFLIVVMYVVFCMLKGMGGLVCICICSLFLVIVICRVEFCYCSGNDRDGYVVGSCGLKLRFFV